MAVSSRMPLEFIAVVGVLMITVAIVEVPRSNMLPPERSGLDAQTWSVPPVARTSATLLPLDLAASVGTERSTAVRRLARLATSIHLKSQRLSQRRDNLAAAKLQLQHTRSFLAPMERALLHTMAMPQDTGREISARQELLESHKSAVLAGTHALNSSHYRVRDLTRSVARSQANIDKLQELLIERRAEIDQPVTRAD